MKNVADLTIGAMVAAVVLMLVAVPVIGDLAGSTSTIESSIDNPGDTYYYRHLDGDYPRPSSITFDRVLYNDGSLSIIWNINETETASVTYSKNKLIDDNIPILFNKIGADTNSSGSMLFLYNELNSNGAPNFLAFRYNTTYPTQDLSLNQNGIRTTNIEYSDSRIALIKPGTTSLIDMGPVSDTYMLCPKEIATHAGGLVMKTAESAIVVTTMDPVAFENISASSRSAYRVNGIIELNQVTTGDITINDDNTKIVRNTYYKPLAYTGTITVEGDGPYTLMIEAFSGSVNNVATDSNEQKYIVIVPTYIEIDSETEYAWLLWLLPVMMGIVLMAAIAYNILPKKGDLE